MLLSLESGNTNAQREYEGPEDEVIIAMAMTVSTRLKQRYTRENKKQSTVG